MNGEEFLTPSQRSLLNAVRSIERARQTATGRKARPVFAVNLDLEGRKTVSGTGWKGIPAGRKGFRDQRPVASVPRWTRARRFAD